MVGVIFFVLLALAALGWLITGLRVLWGRWETAVGHMRCAYCPRVIEPGERIVLAEDGWAHLSCADWKKE